MFGVGTGSPKVEHMSVRPILPLNSGSGLGSCPPEARAPLSWASQPEASSQPSSQPMATKAVEVRKPFFSEDDKERSDADPPNLLNATAEYVISHEV